MPGLAFIDAVPCLRATEFESVDRAVWEVDEVRCVRLGLSYHGGCICGRATAVASGPFPATPTGNGPDATAVAQPHTSNLVHLPHGPIHGFELRGSEAWHGIDESETRHRD